MKNFSLRRFGLLLRLDLIHNKRNWLIMVLGLIIANVLIEFFTFRSWTHVGPFISIAQDWALDSAVSAFFLITSVVVLAGFATTCEIFKTKTRRIYWLTLPATNTEKLLARLLLCTVGMFLVQIVTFAVADGLRMLWLSWRPDAPGSAFPEIWKEFVMFMQDWANLFSRVSDGGLHGAWVALWVLFVVLSLCATYLLGSTLFRRYVFWKTTGIIIVVPILVGFPLIDYNTMNRSITLTGSLVPFTTVVFAVLTVVFIWLAWRFFCRMPVTRKKLF